MSAGWPSMLSRMVAVMVYFFSLVFFIDRGNFWLAVLIPPPVSVVVLFVVRKALQRANLLDND